ncbi:hypothetical protein BCR44DRAFT_230235 [Catenaria anguillulae PL171]|uniref:Uncharacterized protein n=1 Tax=Catenaria anguillulae PL171 TaxID=765915 RepID=A0A1Y2I0K8_9FUNG|nr:hypothetical protein BCR44DRAFT_230235 [Catenaria anguillulae PL171]
MKSQRSIYFQAATAPAWPLPFVASMSSRGRVWPASRTAHRRDVLTTFQSQKPLTCPSTYPWTLDSCPTLHSFPCIPLQVPHISTSYTSRSLGTVVVHPPSDRPREPAPTCELRSRLAIISAHPPLDPRTRHIALAHPLGCDSRCGFGGSTA